MEPQENGNGQSSTGDANRDDNGTTYKEWTNYETWITYRWVMHDTTSRGRWRARASKLAGHDAGAVEVNETIQQLAKELQAAINAECSNHLPGLKDDLLKLALERVVWREVAKVVLGDLIPAALSFDWLFPFGSIVETAGVWAKIPREERLTAVARHAHGDWGELDGVFWGENDSAVRCGERLYSEYESKSGETFVIITAADRSVTTILLPEEY